MTQIVGNKREIKRIAEAYVKAKDDLPSITESDRLVLRGVIGRMFAGASNSIHFDFTKKDPYDYNTIKQMRWDYDHGHIVKVNVSGNNSKMWGPVYNLMFRAVHDYVHARWEFDFNYQAEVLAWERQLWLTKAQAAIPMHIGIYDLYGKILRSEIVYQAAYKTYFKEFHLPVQKIVLADL